MIRPVWHYPLRSETDSSDHLQSDVMRFMAILAFCLVAIFALVQSLPQPPVEVRLAEAVAQERAAEPAEEPEPLPTPEPEPVPEREPVAEPRPEPELLPEPEPVPEPVSEPEPVLVRIPPPEPVAAPEPIRPVARPRPPQPPESGPRGETPRPVSVPPALPPPAPKTAPRPVEPPPSPAETAAPEPEPEPEKGFLLRFATDTALLALVAQRRVEVFGWTKEQAWQLSSQRGLLEFTPASAPRQFHEMAAGTVPAAITAALNDISGMRSSAPLSWGVTLPPDMSRQLQRLLREHDSGTLLIHADGRVRLEGRE
jgi:hypothetical protein